MIVWFFGDRSLEIKRKFYRILIVDKVRFVVSESCDYDGHQLYFGIIDGSVIGKWYHVNSENEISEMTEGGLNSIRIKGGILRNKHFYKRKIEKLRIEERKSITVLKIRKISEH